LTIFLVLLMECSKIFSKANKNKLSYDITENILIEDNEYSFQIKNYTIYKWWENDSRQDLMC